MAGESKSSVSFDWKALLDQPGFEAVSVSLMKHAPGNDLWKTAVTVGMKVLVEHSDIPLLPKNGRRTRIPKKAHWPVTVIKIRGYYLLARYEGKEEDSSHDFWIHITSAFPIEADVHNYVLIPPKCVHDGVSDLRSCLINSLSGGRTLSLDFQQDLRQSAKKCRYKVGDLLEVVDKYKIDFLKIARVFKFFGQRMYLQYLDDTNDGFYCHEKSTLIHSLGWAACVGHKIQLPPIDFKLPTALYDNFATEVNSSSNKSSFVFKGVTFREGMKLEAVDPLCASRICGATICKVLNYDYMMLKMDGYDNSTPNPTILDPSTPKTIGNPGFCYHITSPYIFKCGFCKSNGISLVPPTGHDDGVFDWEKYLKRNQLEAAPIPDPRKLDHGFKVSMKLEMADVMVPLKIYVGTVTQVAGRLLRINFDGWGPEFDQWLDAESPDIYPVGWCTLTGYKLEPNDKAVKMCLKK